MENKFLNVVGKDDKILYCNNTNVGGFVIKHAIKSFVLIAIFAAFITLLIMLITTEFFSKDVEFGVKQLIPSFCAIGLFVIALIYSIGNAKNTYICITDKKIIKRHGFLSIRYEQYDLNNLGAMEIEQTIFDKKTDVQSANLSIKVKNFYTEVSRPVSSSIYFSSLNGAYDAYKILSEFTNKNDDSIKVSVNS